MNYVSIFALTEGENQISNVNADSYDGDDEKVDSNKYHMKMTLIIVFLSLGIVGATSFALYLTKKVKKKLPL